MGLFYVTTNLEEIPRQYLEGTTQPNLLTIWTRQDSATYLEIAKDGYRQKTHYPAFFPLYPLLIRLLANLIGSNYVLAGQVISNLALLVALVFFYKLVRRDYDRKIAERSVFYLLLFPTSIFLVSVYTEALFLCLTLLSFYYARRSHWLLSGSFGLLAALTRFTGVFLLLPLIYEYLAQRRFRLKAIRKDFLLLLLIPSGLLLFFVFLYWQFGSFWKFFEVERNFYLREVNLSSIWTTFSSALAYLSLSLGAHNAFYLVGNLTILITMLALSLISFHFLRPSYSIYAVLGLLVPILSGSVAGMYRYSLVLFPLFIFAALASVRFKPLHYILIYLWGGLWGSVVVLFVSGFPIIT